MVVVLSGSMEPAFQRGDILFLDNSVNAVGVGDVVVFKIKDRAIPIVHRILKTHEKADGTVDLLTKGDNNRVDDRGLYAPGQLWLQREDIMGKAIGTLRYVVMVTITCTERLSRAEIRTGRNDGTLCPHQQRGIKQETNKSEKILYYF